MNEQLLKRIQELAGIEQRINEQILDEGKLSKWIGTAALGASLALGTPSITYPKEKPKTEMTEKEQFNFLVKLQELSDDNIAEKNPLQKVSLILNQYLIQLKIKGYDMKSYQSLKKSGDFKLQKENYKSAQKYYSIIIKNLLLKLSK